MASGRYNTKVQRFNRAEIYKDLRKRRGVNQIQQYLTQHNYLISLGEVILIPLSPEELASKYPRPQEAIR